MTGVPDPSIERLDAGVLRKPFSEAELLQAVQDHIAHARERR